MAVETKATNGSWFRHLRALFNLVALAFVLAATVELIHQWKSTSGGEGTSEKGAVELSLPGILAALLFASLAMVMQFLGWRALVQAWSRAPLPWAESARLYIDSQLARYAPGKIGLLAVRIAGAGRLGVGPPLMAKTLMVELLSWCAVGSSVGFSLLTTLTFFFARGGSTRFWGSLPLSGPTLVLSVSSLLGLLILVTLNRRHYPQKLLSLVDAGGEGPLVPLGLPFFHLLHYLCWVLCGMSLSHALGQEPWGGLFAGAALCLALVAGFLALLAPAGAGVREVVLTYVLTPMWGPSIALSFSVLARAASLLSDVVLWLGARFLPRSPVRPSGVEREAD